MKPVGVVLHRCGPPPGNHRCAHIERGAISTKPAGGLDFLQSGDVGNLDAILMLDLLNLLFGW
jgi:hypothetical protein